MSEFAAVLAIVHGRVQGVYFRIFVERHARGLGLTGYVKNLSGGRVLEVYAEGEKENLGELLNYLNSGPRLAKVERVDVEWLACSERYSHFGVSF